MKVVEVRSQHAHADNRPLHDATTGLHRLAHAEELKIIMIEDYRNWKLLVRDSRNMDLFYVWRAKLRRTDTCGFIFGPASECFTAYMTQMDNVVVMCFERPLRLQSGLKGFFCCCLGQELRIDAPPGARIANISEDCNMWGTCLTIYDGKGTPALKVLGPTLPPYVTIHSSTPPTVLKVQTMAGSVIGEIRIEESISVYFPVNLDVYIKGCLIGCATLVAFMFRMEGCACTCNTVLKELYPICLRLQ
ncbi:phospholipid scramblase 1-like isoform X2 [Ornithodoros turicata]|uniref:phospholipid scramblase 1-like isoform X2 n=1 Tax=Ornithodoros turicata TaxID=34597 RepID=UPI0031396CCA